MNYDMTANDIRHIVEWLEGAGDQRLDQTGLAEETLYYSRPIVFAA